MKRALPLLSVLAALLAAPAIAQTSTPLYFQEAQALTRADPTGNPAAQANTPARPLPLAGVTRYRVTVCAASVGATLSGTGVVRLWVYSPRSGEWTANDPGLAITSSKRCQSWGLESDIRYGWLLPAAVGVGVSSGTQVTVYVDTDSR